MVNLTTGGSPYMTVQERIRPALELQPEVASMNMGSMGFGLFPMLERFKEFKHDWERPFLEGSKDLVFRNTYGDIETSLRELSASGTRFEFECYDTSHLYNLAHFIDRGLIKPPFFVQTVFGILGGIGAHPDDVMHMKRTADRLFGDDYRWSVLGAGRNQMKVAAMAAAMGGNVRVGLEDSLWIAPGSWPRRTPNRCSRCARSWKGWACSRHPGAGPRDPGAEGRRERRVLSRSHRDSQASTESDAGHRNFNNT